MRHFKQSDLTRALRGAEKGGMRVERVEIDASGKMVIFFGFPPARRELLNPWDQELG
jgi:hypothetical protein